MDFIESDNTSVKLTKEQRKNMGAFFTPVYIAEYICNKTLSPLIKKIKDSNKKDKVKEICQLKICDPAMGGGIFLVCAHDFLMEELMAIDQTKYSISEMARMSLKAIYGVDINPKAVEFSKLMLNLNIAKWSIVEKLDEYVSIADQASF
jgi:type I restriction-modification system DNA methylase subunit